LGSSSESDDCVIVDNEIDEIITFYPSAIEFKDPCSYIERISAEAQQHGMCRIVPPQGWQVFLN